MTQVKMNGWLGWTMAVLLVAVVVISGALLNVELNKTNAPIQTVNESAIIAAVLAGIEVPEIDTTKIDRVCELTNGCEYYEVSNSNAKDVRDWVEDEDKDFVEAFSDMVGVDEDYLDIKDITRKETQVRAYNEDDKDDENFEVKVFYRLKFRDVDENEYDYAYFVVSTTLDEGEFDEDDAVLEEVGRSFEF